MRKDAQSERKRKLAEALRANLKRRKTQKRERTGPTTNADPVKNETKEGPA